MENVVIKAKKFSILSIVSLLISITAFFSVYAFGL